MNTPKIFRGAAFLTLVFIVGFSAGLSFTAEANGRHQRQRIREGVQSGQLTKEEAHTLREEQHSIHEEVKQARADGTVSSEERAKIRSDRKTASEHIRESKHNDTKRAH